MNLEEIKKEISRAEKSLNSAKILALAIISILGDTTIGFLNGRWAPGATYKDKILLLANQIYGF